jgi:hypothetical protein
MYLNVISMSLNVFIIYFIVEVVQFNIFPMYLNVFLMYLNVLLVYFSVFTMYFNIFTDIVIGILPLHSQYKDPVMCNHLHIFLFTIHNDFFFNMFYHYPLFFHFH